MVFQTERSDCGKACVRDVLFLVHEEEYLRIAPVDGECRNFSEIKDQLGRYGLRYEGYEVDLRDGLDRKYLPAIALLQQAGRSHFVVLRKVTRNSVLFDDPEFGEILLPREEFLAAFQNRILLKEGVGEKPPIPKIRYFKAAEIILFFLMFLLQVCSAVVSIYSMAESLSLIFSFAGIVVFLGTLLGLFVLLRKTRRRMEETYFLPYLLETRERRDASLLSRYFDLKVRSVTDFFTHGLLLFLMILIFASNGGFYFLIGFLGLLFSLLTPVIDREMRCVERRCSIDEELFLESLKQETVELDSFRRSKLQSRRFGTRYVSFQVSKIVIIAMVILAFMLVRHQFGFNYFLFSLLLCLSVEKTVSSLMRTLNEEENDRLLNSLSIPFPTFLLKKHLTFRYNRRKEACEIDDSWHP